MEILQAFRTVGGARDASHQAEAKNVRIEFSSEEENLSIQGDPVLLRMAANNLIQNAIDFSPENGVVNILLERDGDGMRLAVEDAGPGVPDYAVGRIFDRLYSLKDKVTGRKGSGLGLCFVREAAELHGGHVALVNLPEGSGARGVFWIPC